MSQATPTIQPVYLSTDHTTVDQTAQNWVMCLPCGHPEISGNWWLIGDQLMQIRRSRMLNTGWYWYRVHNPEERLELQREHFIGFEYDPEPGYEAKASRFVHPDLREWLCPDAKKEQNRHAC